MKKITMMFLVLMSFCFQVSVSYAGVEQLNMVNYMFKLNSAPVAVVSFVLINPTDDYNS